MTARQKEFLIPVLAACLAVLTLWPLQTRLETLSGDLLMPLRHRIFGASHAPDNSPTVVIAIDEQTYRTPPFLNTPKVFWTPMLAKVIDAVLEGGAKVVGFDVVFSTSLQPYLPGYEKPFLQTLRRGAAEGRIVLGKAQHGQQPVAPFPAQLLVTGGDRNLRALNVQSDPDFVIRGIPLEFAKTPDANGPRENAMALELAARALGEQPERRPDGVLSLGGRIIPGSTRNALRLNFQGDAETASHSLADLHACAEADDKAYFTRHFKGRVVLVGVVVDMEDRKLTGKRFMTGIRDGAPVPHCRIPVETDQAAVGVSRDSIAGVFIHATAVNNLLRGDGLRDLPASGRAVLLLAMALLVATLAARLRPTISTLWIGAALVTWLGVATMALRLGLLLPVLTVWMVMALTHGLLLVYRHKVMDQQKWRLRKLFGLYLAPALVNRMVDAEHTPELGGEMREVTIWFSDLANFTALSEGISPADLVTLMNRYFTEVTEIIEQHGGFVDKYIGDAILAIFGAPLDDPSHARQAVRACLKVRERLARLNAEGAFQGRVIGSRIGINTGEALVGNVGGARRFNYTVMGDAVNLASRLEGANKALGTTILISGETARQLPEEIIRREIGLIRVKGRQAPVQVCEPLAMPGWGDGTRASEIAALFARALEAYRQGDFAATRLHLAPLLDQDPAADRLALRAGQLAANPPAQWDGVETLLEK